MFIFTSLLVGIVFFFTLGSGLHVVCCFTLLTFSLAGSVEFSGVSCFSSRFDSPVAMTLADVAAVSDGLFRRASSSS